MFHRLFLILILAAGLFQAVSAQDPFISEIRLWPLNRTPSGWALCDGRLLSIAQNTALYSLIGTTYGGDGVQTFALPNLRDRFPQGASPSNPIGSTGGSSGPVSAFGSANGNIILGTENLPAHSHTANFAGTASTSSFNANIPVLDSPSGGLTPVSGGFLSRSGAGTGSASIFQGPGGVGNQVLINGGSGSVTTTPTGTVTVDPTGGGVPVPVNLGVRVDVPSTPPPFINVNYIIALQGYYPSFD